MQSAPADPPSAIAFNHDDAAYLRWRADHLGGFVLNCQPRPTPEYVVLHRASCVALEPKPGDNRNWTVAYIKVCADSASSIESWCRHHVGVGPQRCGRCHP